MSSTAAAAATTVSSRLRRRHHQPSSSLFNLVHLTSSLPPNRRTAEPPNRPTTLGAPHQVVESPLKGLTNDVKRKAPEYLSDITEGFNLKVWFG